MNKQESTTKNYDIHGPIFGTIKYVFLISDKQMNVSFIIKLENI